MQRVCERVFPRVVICIQVEVLDGRIFLSGKVNDPEEKLKVTKNVDFSREVI